MTYTRTEQALFEIIRAIIEGVEKDIKVVESDTLHSMDGDEAKAELVIRQDPYFSYEVKIIIRDTSI